MRLPNTLYVYWSSDDPPCLIANVRIDDMPADEHGAIVGIYEKQGSGKFSNEAARAFIIERAEGVVIAAEKARLRADARLKKCLRQFGRKEIEP